MPKSFINQSVTLCSLHTVQAKRQEESVNPSVTLLICGINIFSKIRQVKVILLQMNGLNNLKLGQLIAS